ncbi:MAG: hypothetical protein EOP06_09750 [Proteobacteria bacterium]|nr:MAG: hypothetical protein EOP06_09750 [Pseudomonadota bacterium]
MSTNSIEKMPTQPSAPPVSKAANERRKHENDMLDEGLNETFPASDPVAVNVTHIVTPKK